MRRCQRGVGPRQMGEAHDIMAACYGMLGLLMQCVEYFEAAATCDCGDEFTPHDPGTCGNCLAGMTCRTGA